MNLDRARQMFPNIGFAVYALDSMVTLEIHDADEFGNARVITFRAPTEQEAWTQAFAITEIEPGATSSRSPTAPEPGQADAPEYPPALSPQEDFFA